MRTAASKFCKIFSYKFITYNQQGKILHLKLISYALKGDNPLHQKRNFPSTISSVNVTKPAIY